MSYFTSVLQIIPYSSTIKTDRHDITEILLKVALNTTTNQTILWVYLIKIVPETRRAH